MLSAEKMVDHLVGHSAVCWVATSVVVKAVHLVGLMAESWVEQKVEKMAE